LALFGLPVGWAEQVVRDLRTGQSCAEDRAYIVVCDWNHFVRAFRQANFITPHQYRIAA
jgi:hypothetical protein